MIFYWAVFVLAVVVVLPWVFGAFCGPALPPLPTARTLEPEAKLLLFALWIVAPVLLGVMLYVCE